MLGPELARQVYDRVRRGPPVTLLVMNALEQRGVRDTVGASLSSSFHGVMRSTLDVDIIADLQREHL